ncbi:alkaline phosphatase D family protein [Marinobacter lipolyticus]|uniref:alkaline phosphatase D family protein n=1 Tax=Marinobacter lipolyticus TaxID=209639 RepID=UPI003A93D6BE
MAGSTPDSDQTSTVSAVPGILAGPVLRRVTDHQLVLWLVSQEPVALSFRLRQADSQTPPQVDRDLLDDEVTCLRIGTSAWIYLLDIAIESPIPSQVRLEYDLGVTSRNGSEDGTYWIRDWAPHLCPEGRQCPGFVYKTHLNRVLHGSCRRPHHPSGDALTRVDDELGAADQVDDYPAMLLMTGDQIYADDVAGPMLHAIQCIIHQLGLYQEELEGASLTHSRDLTSSASAYYHRDELLPDSEFNEDLTERFFGGVRKPIFTTANASNHLISFSEVIAMYLLAWSPIPWDMVTDTEPVSSNEELELYRRQAQTISAFRDQLPKAARALANVPVYMIFDDHDVTDDWNLSAIWESTAYEHPFSRRIIGNALMAYLLCQGWGNQPAHFEELLSQCQQLLDSEKSHHELDKANHDELIDRLFHFHHWHYSLPGTPKLVVLDTRTRRWRSEIRRGHPSGLMDWEALTDFQQEIIGEESVLVVSPAPMFGVKLIEIVQRVFTWFGKPLLVDAENWMTHRGAANVLLNIFGHRRTPRHFVILSGDVHYSFAYDVSLRHKRNSPHIWQITSSGIKNEFPDGLLEWLDRLNRWLFAPRSPLNWFTKRRRMRISPRLPEGREAGERLWNHAGIGDVHLDSHGVPIIIRQLNTGEGGTVFHQRGKG